MRKASKEKSAGLIPNPGAKLFDQLREVMRFHHYSYRPEKTYGQLDPPLWLFIAAGIVRCGSRVAAWPDSKWQIANGK